MWMTRSKQCLVAFSTQLETYARAGRQRFTDENYDDDASKCKLVVENIIPVGIL